LRLFAYVKENKHFSTRLTLEADPRRSPLARQGRLSPTEYHRLASEQPSQDLRVRSIISIP